MIKKWEKIVTLYIHLIWKHTISSFLQIILIKREKYNISENYIYLKKKRKVTLKILKIDTMLVSFYLAQRKKRYFSLDIEYYANFNTKRLIQNTSRYLRGILVDTNLSKNCLKEERKSPSVPFNYFYFTVCVLNIF